MQTYYIIRTLDFCERMIAVIVMKRKLINFIDQMYLK